MKKILFLTAIVMSIATTCLASPNYQLAPDPYFLNWEPGQFLTHDQMGIELIYEQWKEIDRVTMEMQDRIANILANLHK